MQPYDSFNSTHRDESEMNHGLTVFFLKKPKSVVELQFLWIEFSECQKVYESRSFIHGIICLLQAYIKYFDERLSAV